MIVDCAEFHEGCRVTKLAIADINDVNFGALASPPTPGLYAQNRQPANNTGGYLLGKYHFLDKHWLNLGMRTDYRSLVHSTSVHTDSGAHAKLLVSWDRIAREHGIEPAPTAAAGRAEIERAADALAHAHDITVKLPWRGTGRARK